MAKYVALLRGIGPSNPNMHSAPLTKFFESLGFKNVKTLLSSGNVVFESGETNKEKLEELIETNLPEKLGFNSNTIIMSQEELLDLAKQQPFKGFEGNHSGTLNVTFLKHLPKTELKFPHHPLGKSYKLLNIHNNKMVTSVIDIEHGKTIDLMAYLEKLYGKKDVTTRTWKTVGRILKAMEE